MTIHYVLIRGGEVVDRIVAEERLPQEWFSGKEQWVEDNTAQIGWAYDGKSFSPPPRPEDNPGPDPEPDPRDAKIADLEAAVAALKKRGVLTEAMINAERPVKVATRAR